MSNIPENLMYTKSHEWVKDNGDGTVTIGITDHAQELLGDVVFVELPEEGASYGAEDACGVIESVKAASDMYCPISGDVAGVNTDLDDAPESVNTDAYGEGWIFTLKIDDPEDLAELMDAEAYATFCEEEE